MIDVWGKNAKELLEACEDWSPVDVDLGEYGSAVIYFTDDGFTKVDDDAGTELSLDEIEQVIDFALGNKYEHECFWFENNEYDVSDDPIDTIDYYERYVGA